MKRHLRFLPLFGIVFLLAASLTAAQDAKKDKKDDTKKDETKKDDAKKDKKEDKAGKPAVDYYPLAVGNEWKYRVEVGGNSAQAVSKIAKIETIDGVAMARLEATVNGNIVATEHLRATDKGVYRHRNNGQEITPPIMLLKYPAKAGDKWEGDITVGKEKGKYSCESKEENIEVTAGKYKAVKVTIRLESKGQNVTTAYWFVKDVGFVRQTVEAGDLNINMELEKFEPGKDAPK